MIIIYTRLPTSLGRLTKTCGSACRVPQSLLSNDTGRNVHRKGGAGVILTTPYDILFPTRHALTETHCWLEQCRAASRMALTIIGTQHQDIARAGRQAISGWRSVTHYRVLRSMFLLVLCFVCLHLLQWALFCSFFLWTSDFFSHVNDIAQCHLTCTQHETPVSGVRTNHYSSVQRFNQKFNEICECPDIFNMSGQSDASLGPLSAVAGSC